MPNRVMRFIGLLCAGVLAVASNAGNLSGPIRGVVSLANSPYYVIGDIWISSGDSVTIEAGVAIYFNVGTSLLVLGKLDAIGNIGSQIFLRGFNNQTWDGIRFENGRSSQLSYVYIYNACTPIYTQFTQVTLVSCSLNGSATGVSAVRATVTIQNCSIALYGSSTTGISAIESSVVVTGGNISSVSYGFGLPATAVYTNGGELEINHNEISVTANETATGIQIISSNGARVERNIIRLSSYLDNVGIMLYDVGGGITVAQNTIRLMNPGSSGNGIKTEFNRGVDVRNNVLWGQNNGCGWWTANNGIISWDYNLVYGFSTFYFGASPGQHDLQLFPDLDPNTFIPNPGSPVIDAGDPSFPPDPDGTIADIGALPYNRLSAPEPHIALPSGMMLAVWPNPFNQTVRFSLTGAVQVRWHIVDCQGREVASGKGRPASGLWNAEWSPRGIAAGWYLFEANSERGVVRRSLCYVP